MNNKTIMLFDRGSSTVQTRYIPATNTRPARIKAFTGKFSLIIQWPGNMRGLNEMECHHVAALELLSKFKLDWTLAGCGWLPSGGAVFTVNHPVQGDTAYEVQS